MAYSPYFHGDFGYQQENDEDELADLGSLLQQQGYLDVAAGAAPPYYTDELNEGVKEVQRRNGLDPTGDVKPGSATQVLLNEMAAGFRGGAFIHGDGGAPLESASGTSCRRRGPRQRARRGQGGDLSPGRPRPRPAFFPWARAHFR